MAGTGAFEDLAAGEDTFKFYSEGKWQESTSKKTVNVVNPSTRKVQYKVQGAASDADATAFSCWLGHLGRVAN